MRGSTARALVSALLVLALVGVVAIAATGSTPSGSGDTRRPGAALLDTFVSLMLVAFVAAAAILVWGVMQRKAMAREVATGRQPRTGLVGFVAFVLILGALAYWRLRDGLFDRTRDELVEPVVPGTTRRRTPPEAGSGYEPEFAWIPVLVVTGLAAIGALAAFLSARRRKAARGEEDAVAEAIAVLLEETLDDLRAEKDPRRAVIAAYARLERTFAAHRLARHAAETPEEYLTRILPHLEIDRRSVRRLTDLFTRAKFSRHDVDQGMKEEAIDALSTVRDELRSAGERRLEERMKQLRAVAERT